jgi:transketolase N-terminal domain/subunit
MIKEELKSLYRRIFEISYKNRLSHLGSCVTALPIIEEIYSIKKPDEKFVLSSGHAGLALYCVIEKHMQILRPTIKNGHEPNYFDAEKIFAHHGVHPDRCIECGLDCSTGSLGQGLPIAVGMALANRKKNVYCLISDGECSEGSIWEALRIADEQKLKNLYVYVNANGWGAYKKINLWNLRSNFFMDADCCNDEYSRYPNININYKETKALPKLDFLKGQDAHYLTMSEENYLEATKILK